VARAIEAREGPAAEVLVATGLDFPDVLAATPISYSQQMPVLLVGPKGVPGSTLSAIDDVGATSAIVAGGPVPVPESVRNDLGIPSERVYGADRYGTAAALAEYAFEQGWTTMADVGVATGIAFPDGLTGGAALGSADGVVLLTRPTGLSLASEFALSRHVLDVTDVQVLGGTQAVSAGVEQRIGQLLQ
jgi:lactocepin